VAKLADFADDSVVVRVGMVACGVRARHLGSVLTRDHESRMRSKKKRNGAYKINPNLQKMKRVKVK
jgi:hypothetical protein